MLQLRLRCMQTQKHGNAESEMQDAHGHNPKYESSRKVSLAVADGASESVYSEQWGELLVKDYVGKPLCRIKNLAKGVQAGLPKSGIKMCRDLASRGTPRKRLGAVHFPLSWASRSRNILSPGKR